MEPGQFINSYIDFRGSLFQSAINITRLLQTFISNHRQIRMSTKKKQ